MKNPTFVRFLLILSLFFMLISIGFLIQIGYDALTIRFLQTLARPELMYLVHKIFPMAKFYIFKAFLLLFAVLYSLFIYISYKKTTTILDFISKCWFIFKTDLAKFCTQTNDLLAKERVILCFLLVIAFFRGLYSVLYHPINFDEAWTYNYFSSQFPLLAAVYYPSTNNHILCSIISAFFEKIPFLPPLFAIRLPSLLAYIAALYVFFGVIKAWFGTTFSLWASTIFSLLYAGVLYSCVARGYSLQLFFACSNLYFFIKISENPRTKTLIYFGITMLLGLYTIPTFLYYWVSVAIWYFFRMKSTHEAKKRFFYTNIIVGISLFILFLPILFTSSLAIANKNNIGDISGHYFEQLPSFTYSLATYLTSTHDFVAVIWWILLLIGLFGFVFIEKDRLKRNILQLCAFLILSPWLYFTVQQFYMPTRLFIFYQPIVALLIAYGTMFLLTKIKFFKPFLILFLAYVFFTEKTNNFDAYHTDCAEIGEIVSLYQPKTIFTYDEFCKPSILFCCRKKRLALPNIICNTNTTAIVDTVQWLINPPDSLQLRLGDLRLVAKNQSFSLYKRSY